MPRVNRTREWSFLRTTQRRGLATLAKVLSRCARFAPTARAPRARRESSPVCPALSLQLCSETLCPACDAWARRCARGASLDRRDALHQRATELRLWVAGAL